MRDKIVQFLSKRETVPLRLTNKANSNIPQTCDLNFLPKRAHRLIAEFIIDEFVGDYEEFWIGLEDAAELASASEESFQAWRSCTWNSIKNR